MEDSTKKRKAGMEEGTEEEREKKRGKK